MLKKGLSRILIIGFLLVSGFGVHAQNLTQSPYSVVGLGELHFWGSAQLYSLGQTTQGYRRPFEINNSNPASYSSLQQTVFEVGYLYSYGTLNSSTASSNIDNAAFAYFNFGVPISQKHGISLVAGLQPYSAMGYNINLLKLYEGSPDYYGTTKMQGRGGITKFYAGTSVKLHKNISLGVNMNYLFGTIERSQQLMMDTSYHKLNVSEERKIVISDFAYQIGLQYHRSLNEKYKVTAGLTYGIASELDAKNSFTNRSLGWGGNATFTVDTIDHYVNQAGIVKLPQDIKSGIAFEKKGVWLLSADFNYTNWSAYRAFGVNDYLKDCMGISFGASIIPDATAAKNYLKKIEYRLGMRYDNGNVNLYGKDITGYSLSAGLGFPMGKTKSKLNLSVEYLSRGTTSNNLIREELIRFVLGITFSDQWFIRYKYD